MKKKTIKMLSKAPVWAAAVTLLGIGGAQSQTYPIFANYGSYNNTQFWMQNGLEVGNEINVAAGSTLSSFTIEYNAPMVLPADVAVDVRFYYNDGSDYLGYPGESSPQTLFFDSGWFQNTLSGYISSGPDLGGNTAYNLTYSATDLASGALDGWSPSFTLPSEFTYTISWTNLTTSEEVGMPLAANTPGVTGGEYWVNNSGSWELLTNAIIGPANMLVDLESPVPEPSVFGFAAVGGALLWRLNKLRRKV